VGCVEERSSEADQSQSQRVVRIVTKDFPRYFATVTRCRLETATIGPAGAVLSSTVEPLVQAVFPEGALMKSIKVGLQVLPPAPYRLRLLSLYCTQDTDAISFSF